MFFCLKTIGQYRIGTSELQNGKCSDNEGADYFDCCFSNSALSSR